MIAVDLILEHRVSKQVGETSKHTVDWIWLYMRF